MIVLAFIIEQLQSAWAHIHAFVNRRERARQADRMEVMRLIERLRLAAKNTYRVLRKDEKPTQMGKTIIALCKKHGWKLSQFKLHQTDRISLKSWIEDINNLSLRAGAARMASNDEISQTVFIGEDDQLSKREINHAKQVQANKFARTA